MRPLALLLITSLCAINVAAAELVPTCSENAADIPIAERYFPRALADQYKNSFSGDKEIRTICVSRADLRHSGHDTELVVAFANRGNAVLGVIRTQPDVEIISLDTSVRYPGRYPLLGLEDLDGDKIPEIFLQVQPGREDSVWVLRWTGDRLATIGPTVEGPDETGSLLYGGLELFDVTGDGLPDLIQPRGSRFNDDPTDDVYTIKDGKAVLLGIMPWTGFFERTTGEPNTWSTDISATTGQYVLRVINGYGSPRVTSAEVILNDELLFNASDFKRDAAILEATVTLRATNQMRVTVRGEPGASFQLVFLSQP